MKNNKNFDEQWFADNFWNKVRSIDQLQAAIIHHSNVFADNGIKNYFSSKKKLKPTPIIRYKFFTLFWSNTVSNTHCCPYNGVINSYYNKNFPTSYPGWTGRMGYFVQSYKDQNHCYPGGSDLWNNTRINTGTGGGGGNRNNLTYEQYFEYEITLFADDWPLMKKEYEKVILLSYLKNKNTNEKITSPDYLNYVVNKHNSAEDYFSNNKDLDKQSIIEIID